MYWIFRHAVIRNRSNPLGLVTSISHTNLRKGYNRNLETTDQSVSFPYHASNNLEAIIRENMIEFLNKNSIINPNQHGFLEGKSCLTNLLETFEDWTTTLDEGYGLDVIYLDYKKAFDTVPHCRLIKKL